MLSADLLFFSVFSFVAIFVCCSSLWRGKNKEIFATIGGGGGPKIFWLGPWSKISWLGCSLKVSPFVFVRSAVACRKSGRFRPSPSSSLFFMETSRRRSTRQVCTFFPLSGKMIKILSHNYFSFAADKSAEKSCAMEFFQALR